MSKIEDITDELKKLNTNGDIDVTNEIGDIDVTNKSPLRYPGGKTRACKILEGLVNKHFDIKSIKIVISPFFGGGSFEFHLQSKYKVPLLVNDKFTPLANFWKQVKKDKEKLCIELEKQLGTLKETFADYRSKIMKLNDDLFTQAMYYFIINRCSFSGATLSGGFSLESSKKRFTQSSIDRVRKLNLSHVNINNEDFSTFLNKIGNKDNKSRLIFLDPPYYLEKNSKLYGKDGDLHENFDHIKLHEILSNLSNWIMTYNNCKYIKDLYKDYIFEDASWAYGMNKSKESSEIVIINNK